MSLRHVLLSTVLLAGTVLGVAGVRPVAPASAAGGWGVPYLLDGIMPLSPFKVPAAIETQFVGKYDLQSIDQSLRMVSGYIAITRRHNGSLLGMVYFYGYDPNGDTTSWLAILSNFHYVAHNKMAIELFNQAGQDLGDSLVVTRHTNGDLVGRLTLTGKTYTGHWHKTASQ
jgi:hypothetical protein